MDATKTTKRMKSTEEKAKRYDETIKRVENIKTGKCENTFMFTEGLFEYVFPELKESEDEKIRNALLEMVHDTTGDSLWVDYDVHKEDAIAWLEKQAEHANFRNKIQIGDKVTRNEDGVLVNLSQLNRVAKKQTEQKLYVDDNAKEMFIKALERVEEQNNKGYKLTDCDKNSWWEDFKAYTSCIIEQKPAAWSEKDKKMSRFIGNAITADDASIYLKNKGIQVIDAHVWLDELKERVLSQSKQAWSEEDEETLDYIIDYIEKNKSKDTIYTKKTEVLEGMIDWLKSLKDRYTWKPSDEQMNALDDVISSRDIKYDVLSELWKDLKKLREE